MAFFSVTYITATIALYRYTGLGDAAVVYANALNLGARIIYCSSFLSSYVARSQKGTKEEKTPSIWHHTLPKLPVLITFAISAAITRVTAKKLDIRSYTNSSGLRTLFQKPCLIHLGVGATCGLCCLVVWYVT